MSRAPSPPDTLSAGLHVGSTQAAVARLLIRAGTGPRTRKEGDLKALWHWVLNSPFKPDPMSAPMSLQVEVAADQGRRLFVLHDPEGTVDLSLGPGTYDITVVQGSRKRRYTVPLEPGATFDLDLHDVQPL